MVVQVISVDPGIRISFRITLKHELEVVVVTGLARPLVMLGVGKQVVGTEVDQVILANHLVVKVISDLESHMQRMIAVLAHELIEFLSQVVHLS